LGNVRSILAKIWSIKEKKENKGWEVLLQARKQVQRGKNKVSATSIAFLDYWEDKSREWRPGSIEKEKSLSLTVQKKAGE